MAHHQSNASSSPKTALLAVSDTSGTTPFLHHVKRPVLQKTGSEKWQKKTLQVIDYVCENRVKNDALGNNTKYKHRIAQKSGTSVVKVDSETGEILFDDPMLLRVKRFAIQSVVRKLLPKSRTASCLRKRISAQKDVEVWRSVHKTTHYQNLITCSSLWTCPVCASKIAERRKLEVIDAMTQHLEVNGGSVDMLTLTCPHQRQDDLTVLLAKQAKALNNFWKDRQVQKIFAEMGIIGQIRATEVTHGRKSHVNNGWHPHYHIILFGYGTGQNVAVAKRMVWQNALYERWANACSLAGLGKPSREHGLRLDGGAHAARYIVKWGDEVTKGHSKTATAGETPWDFLRSILEDETDVQAAVLFREFATAFKGKRQLHWSKGLKAMFGIGEKSDEALAEESDEVAQLLGLINIDQWRDVLVSEGRGAVLQIAASSSGWDAVCVYLESIRGAYSEAFAKKLAEKACHKGRFTSH